MKIIKYVDKHSADIYVESFKCTADKIAVLAGLFNTPYIVVSIYDVLNREQYGEILAYCGVERLAMPDGKMEHGIFLVPRTAFGRLLSTLIGFRVRDLFLFGLSDCRPFDKCVRHGNELHHKYIAASKISGMSISVTADDDYFDIHMNLREYDLENTLARINALS